MARNVMQCGVNMKPTKEFTDSQIKANDWIVTKMKKLIAKISRTPTSH